MKAGGLLRPLSHNGVRKTDLPAQVQVREVHNTVARGVDDSPSNAQKRAYPILAYLEIQCYQP